MDYDVVRTSAAEGFRLVHLFGFGSYHGLGESNTEMRRNPYFTFGGVPENFQRRRIGGRGLGGRLLSSRAGGRRKRCQDLLAGSGRRWRLFAESEFLLFGLVRLGGRKPGEQL